jgi:hypothetical protein
LRHDQRINKKRTASATERNHKFHHYKKDSNFFRSTHQFHQIQIKINTSIPPNLIEQKNPAKKFKKNPANESKEPSKKIGKNPS